MNKTILVLCGGPSAEHDISLLSAQFVVKTLEQEGWDVLRVYWDPKGDFFLLHPPSSECSNHKSSFADLGFLGQPLVFTPEGVYEKKNDTDGHSSKVSLNFLGKPYCVFPILHGQGGEDGKIQGFFETLDYPYVGSDVVSSALSMDKIYTRQICQQEHISCIPFLVYEDQKSSGFRHFHEFLTFFKTSFLSLGFSEEPRRLFIKTSSLGSSLGIYVVDNEEDFQESLRKAARYGKKILIEPAFSNIRELECAVLEQLDGSLVTPEVGEIIIHHRDQGVFYSYEAKYICPHTATVSFQASLNHDLKRHLQEESQKIFRLMGCSGLARVDFLLTQDNKLLFSEINTMPGMTSISLWPTLLKAEGFSHGDMLNTLLEVAQKNYHYKKSLTIKPHCSLSPSS